MACTTNVNPLVCELSDDQLIGSSLSSLAVMALGRSMRPEDETEDLEDWPKFSF